MQEALELSRHATDAQSFLTLLGTPGRGNEDRRRFVAALKVHLATHSCGTDDIVFEVLKSLSVMVFDYARQNSIAEHHDRTRAQQLASGANRASLYDVLFGLILRSDAIGGETNRGHLKAALHEHGIEIGPALNLAKARAGIEELSRFALRDIKTTVSRQRLVRVRRRRQLEDLLAEVEPASRVVEITGRRVFHGLRKSAVVFLLEAGCTDAEVAAITAQSREMVEHYAKQVNQRRLAAAAILKWEAAEKVRSKAQRASKNKWGTEFVQHRKILVQRASQRYA